MLVKNLPKNKIIPIIISRMFLDGLAGFQFIFKGKFQHFFAILKAHYSFYCLFLTHYKKRDTFQNTTYYRIKSIVYKYYVNNDKVFE